MKFMIEESKILTIVKEDILRILGERKEKASLEFIKEEIKVCRSFVSEAIRDLEEKDLIQVKKNFVRLIKKGQIQADNILRKYLTLEKYFEKARSKKEAHKIAHILEHYISEEVIRNIKKLSTLKGKGIPLIRFKQKEGLIINLNLNIGLFERIISMGIFPGEKIKIINKIPNAIVIEVKNKKFALAKDIAKEIKVLEYDKS